MRLKHKARDAADLAYLTCFVKKKDEDDGLTVTIPDDLSTLTDAEISTLLEQVNSAAQTLIDSGDVSQAAVDALTALGDARDLIDSDLSRRDAATADARAARDAAAARFAPPVVEAEATDPAAQAEGETDEAAAEVVAEAEAVVAEAAEAAPATAAIVPLAPALVAAARPRGPIAVPNVNRRRPPATNTAQGGPASPFRAAMNVPNLAPGSTLSWDDVSGAFSTGMAAASRNAIVAAQRAGQRFSQRYPIAQVERHFAPEATVNDDHEWDAAYSYVTDQSKLKGGSLVASGGWCAPSETLYDFCALESRDGLISIPEINVTRGGVRFTKGPDWATILSTTGFCFTEADDAAANYSLTSETQTLTEGGAGLTSYTITFTGQTTASIDDDATPAQVQAALEALSNIAPGDILVTGATNPINMTVRFLPEGAYGGVDVAQMTTTPTGGTGVVNVATTQGGGLAGGPKPNELIPCPTFEEVRLEVCGVQVQGGNLQNRAYPELTRRFVEMALTGHFHRVATNVITDMIAGSTAVSPTALTGESAVLAPLLSAIELQSEDIRYKYRMRRGTTMEAVFPFWIRGVIRAELSRRQGVDLTDVSDQRINAWFVSRGINPQFVYNWQNLGSPTVSALVWPTSVQFLLYPAGTWVKGASDLISLEMLHDSTLNAQNNFTAIFTEEAWSVMKMCHESRVVTVALCPTGSTHLGVNYTC